MQEIDIELEKLLNFNIDELKKIVNRNSQAKLDASRRLKFDTITNTLNDLLKESDLMLDRDEILQITIKNKKVLTAKIIKELR